MSLTTADVELLIGEWLDAAAVDPETGLPPDAKVAIDTTHTWTFGYVGDGRAEPDSGLRYWSVILTLSFPDTGAAPDVPVIQQVEVLKVLDRLQESLEINSRVGDVELRWRESEPVEPPRSFGALERYPLQIKVSLSASTPSK